MSDLIKRLGASCYLAFEDGTNDYSAAQEAIDRIEELVKDNQQLKNALMFISDEWNQALRQRNVAEAKLTKAVEALQNILKGDYNWSIAREVLAELEGKG